MTDHPTITPRPASTLPPPPDGALCLSVRQPWAWLMFNPFPPTGPKDIENRTWPTKVRGRIYIHAAVTCTQHDYLAAWAVVESDVAGQCLPRPCLETIPRGLIVGSVVITDCVRHSTSAWFQGPYGFVLSDPRPCRFTPYRGRLGFFRYTPNPPATEARHHD